MLEGRFFLCKLKHKSLLNQLQSNAPGRKLDVASNPAASDIKPNDEHGKSSTYGNPVKVQYQKLKQIMIIESAALLLAAAMLVMMRQTAVMGFMAILLDHQQILIMFIQTTAILRKVLSEEEQNALAATPAHPVGYAFYASCLAGNLVEQLWNFAWPSAIALIHPSLLPVAVMGFFTKLAIIVGGPLVGKLLDHSPRIPSSIALNVVQLAGINRPIALAQANAVLNRIDLLCEIAGASLFGILLSKYDPVTCLKFATGLMIWSLPIMIGLALLTNKLSTGVLDHTRFSQTCCRESTGAAVDDNSIVDRGLETIKLGWKEYMHQPVLPASLAYVLLCFNVVLAPGGLMTAFLTQRGVNPSVIGGFSGLCAFMGVLATFLSATLVKRLGILKAGAAGLVFQASLLTLAVVIYWSGSLSHQSPLLFFLGLIVLSRLGHMSYDVVGAQILQAGIPSSKANLIGATEISVASLAESLMLGVAIIANDISHFGFLAMLSLLSVFLIGGNEERGLLTITGAKQVIDISEYMFQNLHVDSYRKREGCCGGVHFSDVLMLNLDTMSWNTLVTTGQGPGPRDSHSAVLVGRQMFVFGGTNGSKKVNDLHVLDLATKEWIRPQCKGTSPCPRESHTATLIGDDRIIIFGGSGEGEANYLNDLHVLDLKTMKWSSPEVKGDIPVPRDSHGAVTIGNELFVYGGDRGDRYHGNVDVLDADTMTWTKIYVIGGVGDKHYYNDVWVLDVVTCSWTQLDMCGQQPQGRFSHTAVVTDSDIAIYGGCGEDERPLNELLILQLGAEDPDGRYNTSMCKIFGKYWNHERGSRQGMPCPAVSDDKPKNGGTVQNLIGAEVCGRVDGAFDSGLLMTATVNGKIFRGILFAPGPEVVSRGASLAQNPSRPANQIINVQPFTNSNHMESSKPSRQPTIFPVPESGQSFRQTQMTRTYPVIRASASLAKEPKLRSDLQGVDLTLGGPTASEHVEQPLGQ
ncbi:hypothetical protein GH714_006242 [Hevea brasiliensis]|uniref:Solute carrier family 40 protein n=1 Tax=Hevea brasiliensis TaxID=3981 RepID=A0A6A6NFW4_HEVBR|nr:hypothetical protein GH714_006242 [Hevea brasiliensis]